MQVFAQLLAFALTALISIVPGFGYWLSAAASAQADAAQPIRRTLAWPAAAGANRILELSNLNGTIVIVAEERGDVAVVASRTVERRGSTSVRLPEIDFREAGDRVLVCGDDRRCGCHVDLPRDEWRSRHEEVRVRVDFELRVPRAVTLDVCGVNADVVRVEGTSVRFTVRNVNGDIDLRRVSGHGEASTVNGDVQGTFLAPPDAASRFRSVNGDVDVTMPPTLAADLRMRTMHGGLFTDFETTPLASRAVTGERRGRRTVYRQDGQVAVRVAAGGPELTFATLNGDVRLRRASTPR
jgi:hypothetical protein